jgi:ABC-2 type transport system permease protein
LWRWLDLLKGLRNIVTKEVKEMMRDPRILLGMILAPLLIFPLMGAAIRASTEAVRESVRTVNIAVADFDQGAIARNLTDYLKSFSYINLQPVSVQTVDEVATAVQASNATAVVVIPPGFSNNITGGSIAELKVYAVFREGSIAESVAFSAAPSLLETFKQDLIRQTIQEGIPGSNPDIVLNPVNISQLTIVKGKATDANPSVLFTFAQTQFISLPIALFMLIILAMQLASTSVASEKEDKTLETLMSLPLSRFTLLVGKLAGSTIVAALGAIATIVGVIYYMGSFTFGTPEATMSVDLAAVGLAPTLLSIVILGLSVFVSLLCALALAVVISVFAEDVRGAQSLLGFVYTPLLIPMFVLMFADLDSLPFALRIVLLALPFTHPMIAARTTITGDYLTAILGIGYVAIFTLVILYIAARIFATEKILTMKLRLTRKKKQRPE